MKMAMKKCRVCGESERRVINSPEYGLVCSRCYQRLRNNSKVYDLPKYGEIDYSEDGKPICHVCGLAFDKVMSHVWQVHEMTENEYKKKFGLETTKGIMSEKSTKLARKQCLKNYALVCEENLLKNGVGTRFKKGSTGRTKEMVSEYTRRKLVARFKKKDRGDDKANYCPSCGQRIDWEG